MTLAMRVQGEELPPEFPPGTDVRALLTPVNTPSILSNPTYRRQVTRESPFRFAWTYLRDHLRQSDTGQLSFCRMHLDMCREAELWQDHVPLRDVWIGPREVGKTFWLQLALPLWALAHGHSRYYVFFSYKEGQAKGHLENLLDELRGNETLLWDYPELAIVRGSSAVRTSLKGGAAIAARGMIGTNLGIRSREARPDLIGLDDIEPGEARNTPAEVARQRARLTSILPMNSRARVIVNGTVTTYGSLIHEFVGAVKGRPGTDWVRANRFKVHYYPAADDFGRSLWPQRWTDEWLRREREADPHGYGLNYDNDPKPEGTQQFWTSGMFRYNSRFRVAERVLHIDPAVTERASSDYTVMVLLGVDASRRRALVERVEWGRWTGPETGEMIATICRPLEIKPLVRVEANNGGNRLLDSYAPFPVGVRFETVTAGAPKAYRIQEAHSHYTRRAVEHPWPLEAFEAELCRYPNVEHDDIPDALAGALEWAFPPGER